MSQAIPHRPGSLAVVQRVRPGFEIQYRQWSDRINSACAEFPGFVDLEVFEPGPGDDCFVIVIHFQSDEEGLAWQASPVCIELLKSAQPFLTVAAVHPPSSTFGGWFLPPGSGKGPQRWKEALTVLFVLYPTVMLLHFSVMPLLKNWPFALSMYVGNLMSVAILTWILMPLVTRWLNFWLTSGGLTVGVDNLKGVTITLGGGLLMVFLFHLL